MYSPVLLSGQKAIGLDHDEGVGCLHGEDEVVVVVLAAIQARQRGTSCGKGWLGIICVDGEAQLNRKRG